jgi:predicted transcriptional regulator
VLAGPAPESPIQIRKDGRWKFSRKPPKDSKVRKAVMVYLALRAQGFKMDEIAEHLGLTKNTIRTYVFRANQAGWINIASFSDPEDQLEHVLKSKAVRNINAVLDEEVTDDSGEKALSDRAVDMTKELAKGTGLFKQHQVTKSDAAPSLGVALKVQIEMPPAGTTPQIAIGSLGGQPAFPGEIIDAETD